MRIAILALLLLSPVVLLGQVNNCPTGPCPSGNQYVTSFPATENPISQSGNWINGGSVGLDWSNMQTTGGTKAWGTQVPGGPGNVNDSIAVLEGTWGPNQTAQGTSLTQANSTEEMEVHLHGTITAHSIKTYEFNCSLSYQQIVKWLGTINSFAVLANNQTVGCPSGAVLKATSTLNSDGSVTLKAFINGTQVNSVTDVNSGGAPYTGGSPGIGAFCGTPCNNAHTGITSYTATDGVTNSWSGLVDPSRAINWTTAGLPSTITYGTGGSACNGSSANCVESLTNAWTPPTRTQCGSTIAAPSSLTAINTALAACLPGTYVLLGAGTFPITGKLTMYAQNGVTLRGSGPQSTTLSVSGSGYIAYGIVWSIGTCTWLTGLSQGSTTLTMNGCNFAPVVGELLQLNQCDSGFSGFGSPPCTTGSSTDNGGLYICSDNTTCANQTASSQNHHQYQVIYPTSITGGPTYTVNFNSPVYMTNWSTSQSAVVTWDTSSSSNNTVTPLGIGLEDMTINTASTDTQNQVVAMDDTYASWVKGVRFVGSDPNAVIEMGIGSKNCLVMNNYIFSDLVLDGAFPVPIQEGGVSDSLIINNIMASSVPWEGNGGDVGDVLAYNYGRDVFTSSYQNTVFDHHGGSSFHLFEGNEMSNAYLEDNTWGTHNVDTWHRNYAFGWDPPYTAGTINPRTIDVERFQRFTNFIGNVLGPGPSFAPITNYQLTSGGSNFIFLFVNGTDPLVLSTGFRWGNCDTVNNNCRNQSSEVPVSLTGNAIPLQNLVPQVTTLPCSFFLLTFTSTTCTPTYTGGTNLNFWKVCKTWTTFPTACATTQTQPFPPIGPDIINGTYVNGTAYDVPAAIAFKNLPIDNALQNSYSITASSWASGTETLTVSGLPNTTHLMGPMQISGGACATSGAGTSTGAEVYITASAATTVSYALASNPGACVGTMLFPDVRQFDERVYQLDSSGGGAPIATFTPATVNIGQIPVGTTSNPVSVILKNTGTTNLVVSGVTPGTPYNLINNNCGTSFTLAPSASCTFQVTATPTGTAAFTGGITFSDNAGNPDVLLVTGAGTAALAPIMFAGKVATHTLCKPVPAATELCLAADCNCWWVSMNGAAYIPFGVSSVNGKTGNVTLGASTTIQ